MALYCSRANDFGRVRLRMTLLSFATGETAYLGTSHCYVYPLLFPVFGGRAYSSPPPCLLRRGKEEDAIIPKISASVTNPRASPREISIFVRHDRSVLTACGAPVGREGVIARAIICWAPIGFPVPPEAVCQNSQNEGVSRPKAFRSRAYA